MLAIVSLIGALLLGSPAEPVAAGDCEADDDCSDGWDADTIGPADVPKDAPRFAEFPAKVVRIARPAKPDVHTARNAREFRTMIRYAAASRLIVIPGTLNEDKRTRGIHWFVWDERRLDLVRFVPHLLRAQVAAPHTP